MVAQTRNNGSISSADAVGRNQLLKAEQPLSTAEAEQLRDCEAIIQTRLRAFFEVGQALMGINRNRLYRAEFRSFEEYCRTRWEISRIHAFRLLKAAEVHQLLLPIGNIPLPENEAQIRPLTALPPNKAKLIWQKAIKKAAPGKVTAKVVRLVISESEGSVKEFSSSGQMEWQHQITVLLQKIRSANERGKLHEASEILERIRVVLDVELAREARCIEAS